MGATASPSARAALFPFTMTMRRLTSGAVCHAYAEQGARACVQYDLYRMGWCMVGFKEARQQVIRDLQAGNFVHEVRRNISSKNLLLTGSISASDLAAILKRARGQDHRSSPHHRDADIRVHEILDLPLQADLVTLSACDTALGSGYFAELPVGDEGDATLGDLIEDTEAVVPADAVGFTMLQQELERVLDSLHPREAGVIRSRFGLGDGVQAVPCFLA